MRTTLVRVGGALNALFFAFHLFLGWRLHITFGLDARVQALLEMFNVTAVLAVGFFAFVSLAYPRELLATRVGRAAIGLIVLVYVTRAAGEYVLAPAASWPVAAVCLLVAAVYAVAALLREPAAPVAEPAPEREEQPVG